MAFRVVQQEFWTDEKISEDFTSQERYFFLYLLTNPYTNQLGIYKLPLKHVALECGYSKEEIIALIDRLQNTHDVIRFNPDTKEVAIANFLIHNIITGGTPVMNTVVKNLTDVKDRNLIIYIYNKISVKNITNKTILSIIEIIKTIINDNDNGESIADSVLDSISDSEETLKSAKKEEPPKHIYGEFKHVRLSDDDVKKITDKVGCNGLNEYIRKLDEYIESTHKVYHNHYLTINNWINKDKEKGGKPSGNESRPTDSAVERIKAKQRADAEKITSYELPF